MKYNGSSLLCSGRILDFLEGAGGFWKNFDYFLDFLLSRSKQFFELS